MKNIALIILFFITVSCEKQDDEETLFTFPIKYCFLNNGSKEISRIVLETLTFYPNQNKLIWLYSGKNIYDIYNEDTYLHEFDSLIHIPDEECYLGCITYLKAVVFREDSLGIERKVYFERYDTIENTSENYFELSWPEDSALFYKLNN